MIRRLFLSLISVGVLVGCTAPEQVNRQATPLLVPECLELFNSFGYQSSAQDPLSGASYFAIGPNNAGVGAVCSYYVTTNPISDLSESQAVRKSKALANCEAARRQFGVGNPCVIFAEGNNIIYRRSTSIQTTQRVTQPATPNCRPPREIPVGYWEEVGSDLPFCKGDSIQASASGKPCKGTWSKQLPSCKFEQYLGEWERGAMTGKGIFFYSDGSRKTGIWKNGSWIGPLPKPTQESTLSDGEPSVPSADQTQAPVAIDTGPSETNSDIMSMDEAKAECEELGLTPKTEKFGTCVLTLIDR